MNKPIDQLDLVPAELVKAPEIGGISRPAKLPVSSEYDGHDFNWGSDNDSIIIPHQPAIAVYFNPRGEVVIRQEGHYRPDEDHWIVVQIQNLDPLIDQLQRIASREIEPA